ncbi:hypothetical protein LINGRAHAP2_LOCUS17017 [Linum grandiflorum]
MMSYTVFESISLSFVLPMLLSSHASLFLRSVLVLSCFSMQELIQDRMKSFGFGLVFITFSTLPLFFFVAFDFLGESVGACL